MRGFILTATAVAMLATSPAMARDDEDDKERDPITERDPSAVDVAATPVTDLNLRKDEIPQMLIDAQDKPYDLQGLRTCRQIIAEVRELDTMLGDDIDLPQDARRTISATRVAQSVVGSFIPFRGIIREISGANDQKRKVEAAVQAGLARRGFLKGVGQGKGCGYPGRPAPDDVIEQRRKEIAAENNDDDDKKKKKDKDDD